MPQPLKPALKFEGVRAFFKAREARWLDVLCPLIFHSIASSKGFYML